MVITKQKIIDELRIIRIEIIQNDFTLQSQLDVATDKRIRKAAIKVWKKNRKLINKKLDKIEKQMYRGKIV